MHRQSPQLVRGGASNDGVPFPVHADRHGRAAMIPRRGDGAWNQVRDFLPGGDYLGIRGKAPRPAAGLLHSRPGPVADNGALAAAKGARGVDGGNARRSAQGSVVSLATIRPDAAAPRPNFMPHPPLMRVMLTRSSSSETKSRARARCWRAARHPATRAMPCRRPS
jgi:hypothetical protein